MVTLLHHMVHVGGMKNTNVWNIYVLPCSSSQTFDLPWEYTTNQTKSNQTKTKQKSKQPKKPQNGETVLLQTGLGKDSTNLLNWRLLFNIDFRQALTGFSNSYTARSWTACVISKNKEPVPQ